MKIRLKIKLLPSSIQSELLLSTIKEANLACNAISKVAWSNRVFQQFKLHKICYHEIKTSFNLSSQVIVRAINKVSNSYKISKNKVRKFNEFGGISYDSRILSYLSDSISIWTINGRVKIPFIINNPKYTPYIKGEADLVYKKGKFYLFQTVEIPDVEIKDINEFIGVDFGLTDIAVTSDGVKHSAEWLNEYREKRQNIRSSIQRKGTRGARRLLKRLSGREKTTAAIVNHTISKSIVCSAKTHGKGIAIEDLTGIRFRSKRKGKKFKSKLGRWGFYQLRYYLEYKSKLSGVKLIAVNPAYTSKTCCCCHHIGIRKNKSFVCQNCGNDIDADVNASINIATLGAAINQPEKSEMYSCAVHF